jgi:acetyltransferase-like isoleucine patch superfamily enzyme
MKLHFFPTIKMNMLNAYPHQGFHANLYKSSYLEVSSSAHIYIEGHLMFNGSLYKNDQCYSRLIIKDKGALIVHGSFEVLYNATIDIRENAILELGSGYINQGCTIFCHNHIKTGNDVALGMNLNLRDSDAHSTAQHSTAQHNYIKTYYHWQPCLGGC